MKKLEIPTKEILSDLYIENKMSMSDIASIFGVSTMTVRSWLNRRKVKTRISKININHELRNTEFNDKQKSLLVGSILGDGCLRIPKRGKNAYFSERHCESQRMYLQWKNEILKPFSHRKLGMELGGDHNISGVDCVTQNSYKLTTISHPYLTELWKTFYKGNGNKILPIDINKYLNIFVIAVWICDDGSLVWNNIRRTYRIDLHTENFSYDENVYICRVLSRFFKGKMLIIPRQYKNGKRYYISLRGKSELHEFCSSLKIFVPECMWYKFETYI